jgi:predicted ribosomally synthesized peptide with nif11-like leader
MSIADAERFAKDLGTDKALLAEVMQNASGVASVVKVANAHGYSVTVEEAKQYIESRSPKELTDDQLDAVAGGKSKGKPNLTSTSAVQTTTVVSTTLEAAEVASTALVATQVIAVGAAVFT